MPRPYYTRLQPYAWRDQTGTETPGIAIWKGPHLALHLTQSEAVEFANNLVDLIEKENAK